MRATRFLTETDYSSSLPTVPSQISKKSSINCRQSSHWIILLLFFVNLTVRRTDGVGSDHPLIDVKTNPVCSNFTNDSNDREFVTPNYPNNYPNGTECYKKIEAPHGYVIRLEFREAFNVEPSINCDNDHLEVRDGPYGFNRLIGKFCGHSFPGEIVSTDRYLWLRFCSDEDIEYGGFKVAYKFILSSAFDRPEIAPCFVTLKGLDGPFGTMDIQEERYNYTKFYNVSLMCIWEIDVDVNYQIFLKFVMYQLQHVNDCDKNFIDVFNNNLEIKNRKSHFCGTVTESLKLESSKVYVLFYSTHDAHGGQFSAIFTAVRQISYEEDCVESLEFDCMDNTCIDYSLRCNDRPNCKYDEDEVGCKGGDAVLFFASQRILLILIIGLALLLSITIPSCRRCYRKWRQTATSAAESVGQRTAEGSLHESHMLSTVSGGIGQTNDAINVGDVDDYDDGHGCYVPEMDLSVFLKRSNGGHAIITQDVDNDPPYLIHHGHDTPLADSSLPFDSSDPLITSAPPPPVLPPLPPSAAGGRLRCSVHPNNPSLYNELPIRKRNVTPPLPPPPPPSNFQDHNNVRDTNNYNPSTTYTVPPSQRNDTNSFQTFLPPPPTEEELDEAEDSIFGLPPSAPISIGRANPSHFKAEAVIEMQANRPRSFESTKSAPDVVGRR